MVTTGQTQDLGQYAEVDTVVRVAVEHRVHRTVNVQQHAVVLTPLCQLCIRRPATGDVIVHDDRRADFFGVFCTFHHFIRGCSGDV